MPRLQYLWLGLALRFCAGSLAFGATTWPKDEEIRSILQNWVEREHWGVGIVVGLVDESGTRVVSFGNAQSGAATVVNSETLFEIGSVTKTFTALLLADLERRGEMKLDDPLEKHLPAYFTSGDPAWGLTKRLSVRYRADGQAATVEAGEGSEVELPPRAEILQARYGDLASRRRTVDVTTTVAKLAAGATNGPVKIRAENKLAERRRPLKVPAFFGRKITLRDLATHRSGLPRDFEGDLLEQLSKCRLARAPGSKAAYSNFGLCLLAYAMERKTGTNFEALVRERICRPLGMESTCVNPSAELRARLAKSHDLENRVIGDHADQLAFFPGSGAIRSTASDMLKYLAAQIGLTQSPLTPAMERTHALQARRAFGDADLALPWWIFHRRGAELFTHGGTTWGQQAFIGFDKKARRGVVVLSNRPDVLDQAVGPLGLYLLAPSAAEPQPAPVDSKRLESCAGLYQFKALPQATLRIRPAGDRLVVQFLNSVPMEWIPVAENLYLDRWQNETELRFGRDIFGRRTAAFTTARGQKWRAVKFLDDLPDEAFRVAADPLRPEDCAPRAGSPLQGSWTATARPLFLPFLSLNGSIRIAERSDGTFRGEFDIADLGVHNLPVAVHQELPAVILIPKSGAGLFVGKIGSDQTRIAGRLMAGGRRLGTVLRRMPPRP